MTLAAKTACGEFCDSDGLRFAFRRLPQALELIKPVQKAHKKPGTIFRNYSLFVPYMPGNTACQPQEG
ncbi:hypothetical protein BN133_3998 [Cronobacter dublinensis 582]|nr:hypothetical protein BN133_3998 [Cronobacter dublinensis 582]